MSVRFLAAITRRISATAGFSFLLYLLRFDFTVTPDRLLVSGFSVMRMWLGELVPMSSLRS